MAAQKHRHPLKSSPGLLAYVFGSKLPVSPRCGTRVWDLRDAAFCEDDTPGPGGCSERCVGTLEQRACSPWMNAALSASPIVGRYPMDPRSAHVVRPPSRLPQRVTPGFFAGQRIGNRAITSLEEQDRLTDPMHYNGATDRCEPIVGARRSTDLPRHLRALESSDRADFYTSRFERSRTKSSCSTLARTTFAFDG